MRSMAAAKLFGVPGIRFMPNDQEIIYYLKKKASKEPLPSEHIVEKELYGPNANPWMVFDDNDPWEKAEGELGKKGLKRVVHVFTILSRMSPKKVSRIAGCGSWEGKSKADEIKNQLGEIIGVKKTLNFEEKGSAGEKSKEKGHWIMHEYSLAGVSLEGINENATKYVACKILREYSKCSSSPVNLVANYNINSANTTDIDDIISSQVLGKRKASSSSGSHDAISNSKMLRSNYDINPVEEEVSTMEDIDDYLGCLEVPDQADLITIDEEISTGRFGFGEFGVEKLINEGLRSNDGLLATMDLRRDGFLPIQDDANNLNSAWEESIAPIQDSTLPQSAVEEAAAGEDFFDGFSENFVEDNWFEEIMKLDRDRISLQQTVG